MERAASKLDLVWDINLDLRLVPHGLASQLDILKGFFRVLLSRAAICICFFILINFLRNSELGTRLAARLTSQLLTRLLHHRCRLLPRAGHLWLLLTFED